MGEIIAGTYEIMEKLGAGGGGTVYLARHLRLEKKVVLKADKRKLTTRPELLRREVDVLKELNHPHIPRVLDFFVDGETVYTAMDYIEGESLDKPLKRGEKFSQPQVIQWAMEILEALAYLHSPIHGDPPRGFVHSDIKPANLMRMPDNHICLIDFNIALALGEKNVVGCSAGYASPEHYGFDFSLRDTPYVLSVLPEGHERREIPLADDIVSMAMEDDGNMETVVDDDTETLAGDGAKPEQGMGRRGGVSAAGNFERESLSGRGIISGRRSEIVPDVRSDIYSVGATLYHLLSGARPAREAWSVVPLSEKEFTPSLTRIIAKAMNLNPELRYQTAEEMLEDFRRLRERDPRVRQWKRGRFAAFTVWILLLLAGAACTFTGLSRMNVTERWLKYIGYAEDAIEKGDRDAALHYAQLSLPEKKGILEPELMPEAQRVLTDALGIYDLADRYEVKSTVQLPSAPFYMTLSPSGKTAVCLYAYEAAIIDTNTGTVRNALPARESALSEAVYAGEKQVLLAGRDGLVAWDTEKERVLWTGEKATAVCLSGDGSRAAAVDRQESFAVVYAVKDGERLAYVDFHGKKQSAAVNDNFANPHDNLLALNQDGTLLAASFEDGSLEIFDLQNPERNIVLFEEESGYTHFEGGFHGKYFAFSATGAEDSLFAVIDTEEQVQTGGFEAESAFGTTADETGIYVSTENLLVKIHPTTGEQQPLVTTQELINSFSHDTKHTLICTESQAAFFNSHAVFLSAVKGDYSRGLVALRGECALLGNSDSPVVYILEYRNPGEGELLSYDPALPHDEARISANGKTIMLFSYERFYIFDSDGKLVKEVEIPDAQQVYDQQYIRDSSNSWLEVLYNDGRVTAYSAADGIPLWEKKREKPDREMKEEFLTERYRIESPLHGTPTIYDRKTGKQVGTLEEDAYLTYVTQAEGNLVVQYVTADGQCYGKLLDEKCRAVADLPYLCDVWEEELIFDYPAGNIRKTRIYGIEELLAAAREGEEK